MVNDASGSVSRPPALSQSGDGNSRSSTAEAMPVTGAMAAGSRNAASIAGVSDPISACRRAGRPRACCSKRAPGSTSAAMSAGSMAEASSAAPAQAAWRASTCSAPSRTDARSERSVSGGTVPEDD